MNKPKPPRRFNGYAKLEHGSAWVSMQPNDTGHYVEHQDYAELLAYANYLEEKNMFLRMEVERLKNNCAYLDKKLDEELDK
jgi:hypothetical protein